jgi:hypothetical protein
MESWRKGPETVQVKSVYLWLAGYPVSQLAGIKLRAKPA